MIPSPPTSIRISLTTQGLSEQEISWLEFDLKHFFPGVRLVAVYADHCDWEGRFQGELWTEARVNFLVRHQQQIEARANPSDPRLDLDIYNVGLLYSPSLFFYERLKDDQFAHSQLGYVFYGPYHGLGHWWQVVNRDPESLAVACLPVAPPAWSQDAIPQWLYQVEALWNKKEVAYWCSTCWKNTSTQKGVTQIPLLELREPHECVTCGRDFCAEDARAPQWADYHHRFLWRSPRAE